MGYLPLKGWSFRGWTVNVMVDDNDHFFILLQHTDETDIMRIEIEDEKEKGLLELCFTTEDIERRLRIRQQEED